MKRALTIVGITLISLVAIVLIAATLVVWVVVTPDKLTPIVRDVAKEYVTVPHQLGDIDLTFFSSFPAFGVRIEGLEIVNPVPGAQNDTLLSAGEVVATIDIMAFLNDNKLDIRALTLRDVHANIYIDSVGKGNWDVFALPPDTLQDEDTTAFKLPFDEIHVDNAMMASNRLTFVDRKDSIEASIDGFGFDAQIESWDDIRLKLRTLAVNAKLKDQHYVRDAKIEMDLPCSVHLDSMYFALHNASLSVEDLKLGIDGWAQIGDSITMDVRVTAKEWEIAKIPPLVPDTYRSLLKQVEVEGLLSLDAHAYGAYADSVMPIVDAQIDLQDGEGQYKPLPYKAQKVQAQLNAHLDLNDSLASYASATLSADTKQSHLEAEAEVKELLGNPLIDGIVRAKANIPDFAYFMPKNLKVKGKTEGEVKMLTRLSELTSMNIARGHYIDGRFDINRLSVDMDDIHAELPKNELSFRIPNGKPTDAIYRWLGAQLKMQSVKTKMADLKAETGNTNILLETNNILSSDPVLKANLRLACEQDLTAKNDSMSLRAKQPKLGVKAAYNIKAKEAMPIVDATLDANAIDGDYTGIKAALQKTHLTAHMHSDSKRNSLLHMNTTLTSPFLTASMGDSVAAKMSAPKLSATMQYDTKDTTTLPTIDANLLFATLNGNYTDIAADLKQSNITMGLCSEKNQKHRPKIKASLSTTAMQVAKGEVVKAKTAAFAMDAQAHYNDKAKKFLLQWNPKLNVNLQQGHAELAMFNYPIVIPAIDFSYSNRMFVINRSQVHLGSSDFSLSGKVNNIGEWLEGKGVLQGDLNFVSDYTDVNELMTMFSAEEGSEEEHVDKSKEETATAKQEGPFLVPTDVDLTLNTKIKMADVFTEQVHDLKGKMYVKNGILALEEMGFVCNAAKLQLTAMYRTPRRNHLYLGLDYHMLDVDIDTLIEMIPTLTDMVPMLSSFKGNAEFHLAAETYLNQKYEPKMSTLRGAASLSGKDLVVMDTETFSKISKLLMFNKKTENKVDSISAEVTVYKNEIDVYPFCVQMDNYMVAMGGRHNTNMTFDYDINVLKPIYLGVNVSGSLDNLNIKLAKCKFAKDFRPTWHRKVDTESADLRRRIRQSMQKNVKQ